jgi:mannonate dehydratase
MRIVDAKVIVCSPGRNFVTLKVTTDEGVTGVGDATLNGRELAVASYLSDHVVPLLIGRDPARIEDTWQYLYQGAYWRRGPVTMSAIAAVDTALWDIKAKVAGLPLYQLLGGRSRDGVTVYGHANGETVDDVLTEVARYVELGYRAVRVQSGIPGLSSTYGVGKDRLFYEPADAAADENVWSTPHYLSHVPTVFERVRAEFGPYQRLLHDEHHRLTPIEAARLGRELEPYHLTWLETRCRPNCRRGSGSSASTPPPRSRWRGLQHHLGLPHPHHRAAHRLRPDHRGARGGITHLRRIFDLAAPAPRPQRLPRAPPTSPRSAWRPPCTWTSRSPTSGCRSTCATPRRPTPSSRTDTTSRRLPAPVRGPGLGVDIDEALAAEYPYQAASLPVNRLTDGTLHPW